MPRLGCTPPEEIIIMSDRKGEGSYDGAEKFQKEERDFVKSGQVPQKAREAADALDGEEGEELEAAREASAMGETA
jgi:hypothetical protein